MTGHAPQFFDIGVNLNSGQFKSRVPEILARAYAEGVTEIIAIASDHDESLALSKLEAAHGPKVWITAGIHPHQATTFNAESLKILAECYQHRTCVAIGECGLDYNRMYAPKPDQIKAFEAQLELAAELQAPLYLHERDAHEDFVALLHNAKSSGPVRGVIHCFTSGPEVVKTYLDLGLYIGVTGWVCDERRGDELRDALRYIPSDRLVIETDAPYLKPRTYKGPLKIKGNEPCLLPHIAHTIANLLGSPIERIATESADNARRLFGLVDTAV